ncbi:Small G protein signaling modulator 2, variant 2 [Schistosoma haematobium]|uniref:Small G protein signaling modulator 2, variant 2 n=2 Tax=Schistosoma haematobium TaxID=6185 RepID=A0A922LGX4_SCHHA|nr:Small G protein signaling modulator 2, variant 2 [Schistosoma haematobium]KAH9583921.1 Small G protein signaling modulator 2, variant 2 [Schistosoma haematobium]
MIGSHNNNDNNDQDIKEDLLKNVKIQVKMLMEEAVIRGYVHDDSETIGKLCSSVEAVLLYGVRRSIFTWIEEESTYVLCQKIAKFCPEAQHTLNRIDYYKQTILKKRNDSDIKRNLSSLHHNNTMNKSFIFNEKSSSPSSSMNFTFWLNDKRNNLLINGRPDTFFQNFWIRVGIYEKVLDKIVKFLADNTLQYYEPYSVIADPCYGQLISDLLRGPCTIDYSHTRTTDHLYTDPSISELIQRRGIYSSLMSKQLTYIPPISSQQLLNQSIQQSNVIDIIDRKNNDQSYLSKYTSEELFNENSSIDEDGYNDNGNMNDHSSISNDTPPSRPPSTATTTTTNDNNNRRLFNSHKIDNRIDHVNHSSSQSNWMCKRGSSPLINISDMPTNRTVRTGSCAFLPQMNEFNSTKSSRNFKSNKHIALAAKEHVESMHQSLRTRLLYGKNNVLMQPSNSSNPIPGYLSLIDGECGKLIVLKWTPNSAVTTPQMNNHNEEFCFSNDSILDSRLDLDDLNEKEAYWGYAIKIKISDVVYGHLHEFNNQYILTFIRNDGIQLAPFHFYAQSHVLTFLNCLEQGLKQRGGYLNPSSELDTSTSVTSEYSMKSYRPSMPFIFGNRNSLSPPLSTSITNNDTKTNSSITSSQNYPSTLYNKPSKLNQSLSLTSSKLRQRIYMNILKAFNHTDNMSNDEELQAPYSSPSICIPEEKCPIQHVYMIVSKTRDSHAMGIMNNINTSSILSKRLTLDGISEETINESDDIIGQSNNQLSIHRDVFKKLRNKILSHVFHKWYNHFNKLRTVRKKLADLVSPNFLTVDSPTNAEEGVTVEFWNQLMTNSIPQIPFSELCRYIYFGNCDPTIRNEVWPYLLGLYTWNSTSEQLNAVNIQQKEIYTNALNTWNRVVQYLKQDVRYANFVAIVPPNNDSTEFKECLDHSKSLADNELSMNSTKQPNDINNVELENNVNDDNGLHDNRSSTATLPNEISTSKLSNLSTDSQLFINNTLQDQCEFSPNTLEIFADNLYRIDKDVTRCDRNHTFFMTPKKGSKSSHPNITELSSNLIKLRNIISTWVWLHLDIGYIQGMCDLLAPILIIIEDEIKTFACFNCLMKWMLPNFPLIKNSLSQSSNSIKLSPSETHLLLTPSSSSSSSSKSTSSSMSTNHIEKTINNNDNNDCTITRTTLLQMAVKAARRRTTTMYSKDNTIDSITSSNNNHSKQLHYDNNTLRCTNKLKETPSLSSTTSSAASSSSSSTSLERITDKTIEQSYHHQNTNIIISPYDKLLLNSSELSVPCMDIRFSFLQSLIEIFDPEMNNHLAQKVPEGQLLFSYRWLLLDFKRELQYDDIFPVWETIWASRRIVTYDFGIFFALALLEYYRDILIYYNMDITEIIRFYNELTEQHDCVTLLELARSFVFQLQHLMVDR